MPRASLPNVSSRIPSKQSPQHLPCYADNITDVTSIVLLSHLVIALNVTSIVSLSTVRRG